MKNLNDKILTRPWSGPGSNGPCLGTVHYLWAGGGRRFWGGGHLFLASRWEGGHLFLARKNLKKPAKPIFLHIFLRDFGEGATYFWQVAERGGHLFLAASKNKISGPLPPINNEQSLSLNRVNIVVKTHHGWDSFSIKARTFRAFPGNLPQTNPFHSSVDRESNYNTEGFPPRIDKG